MATELLSPQQATYWFVSGRILLPAIHVLGILCFAYIMRRRLLPLLRGAPDIRFDRPLLRVSKVLQFWLAQWKHPRYPGAGILHISIFAGFLLLAFRAFTVLIAGGHENFLGASPTTAAAPIYEVITAYATTVVFLCMLVAIVRRIFFGPARYGVPPQFGKSRRADAIFLLALIATLMMADSLYEASKTAANLAHHSPRFILPAVLSLPWLLAKALAGVSSSKLWSLYCGAYVAHQLTFYFLLCYRPFGIQFHVETSLFNVFFSKLDRGTVKPAKWRVSEQEMDQLKSIGVKRFEDFTWKHMLDFYSCADCGRCSDNCPANAVGRPLSPRFLTIKSRNYSFKHYSVFGRTHGNGPLVGEIYSPDEIWSCTTCGACEEECPLLIEYIDKIVDLRRGLVDEGMVPQTLQKPLKALESRGNPYGKLERNRGEWAKDTQFSCECQVKLLEEKDTAETLYFVDSITSYDTRMQSIARAVAKILSRSGESFGILGAKEKDSGHEVRRFGEEALFRALRDGNTEAIRATGVRRIVTTDPHAYNALKHDYTGLPSVEHISQTVLRGLTDGRLQFKAVWNTADVYTYHDPCYLGRHNQIYDEPRQALDAIPHLKRVEMKRTRDRSSCCGGGGLMLFYEPKEEQRMGVMRVRMAQDAGANVIVTACPYCMANIEDAIKVAGLEGQMSVIDLAELVEKHMAGNPLKEAQRCGELAFV